MAFNLNLNLNLTIAIQGVPANFPIAIGVSFGEPKIVTQQPIVLDVERSSREQWERDNPLPLTFDQRTCARCSTGYRETVSPWPLYPTCPNCEQQQFAGQCQREISEPRRPAGQYLAGQYQREISEPRRPALKSFNEINNVNWKEEGF